MKKIMMIFISVFLLMSVVSVKAEQYWATGKISRTLADTESSYGGCMIYLSNAIGSGCPSQWISLDCKGTYFGSSEGSRKYASAIVAASMDKNVSVYVDNNKKYNGYCVVRRLDILF